jgi:superfamily II DNA or RNA helicase
MPRRLAGGAFLCYYVFMKFESFSRPKSTEELQGQTEKVSQNLDASLIHESMKKDLELLSVSELKEKYKVRYDAYLAMLRAEKQGKNLEARDLEKAQIYITAFNNLDNYILEQARGERKVLRGRQIHVFDAIRDALEKGITRGYIKLPTGVGKTVLFSQVLEALKMKAMIGVPSLPLVRQTSDKLENFTNRTYGVYTGERKDLTKEITTITYQSLISAVRNNVIKPDNVPIFIADEAHKASGPETTKAMKDFELVLEFTATPGHDLPEKIYEMKLKEAIQEGLVCRTKTIHAYTNVDLSSVPIVAGEYDPKILEKVVNNHGRNMAAIELYKNKFQSLKAMVNCTGVQHAKDVAELFQKNGVKAIAVYGDMLIDEKNRILGYVDKEGVRHPSMIETGEVQVITNAKLLIEGFDEQSISVALNLDPTMSTTKAEQRGGRALRLDDNNPDKWGYVIDFIDQNSKRKCVLFSQILEGAEVELDESVEGEPREFYENQEPRESIPSIDLSNINIEGLRVVVDTHEIMEVTKEHKESQEKKEKKEWTLETLQADVKSKGIKSSSDYVNKSSENGWPYISSLTNMPGFPKKLDGTNDWDAFLEQTRTLEDIQIQVRAEGIKSSGDYANKSSENGWPSIRYLTNMPGFPKKLDGTNDWDAFLEQTRTLEDIQIQVRAEGIKSSVDYKNKSSENGWPVVKTLTSMQGFPKNLDGTNDWDTFLDVENLEKQRLLQVQIEVRAKGIKSSSDYGKKYSENGWPGPGYLITMPGFPKTLDGSSDWDTFLERQTRTLEDIENQVRAEGIMSSRDYQNKYSENGWPGPKTLTSMQGFPKNLDGTNDWDTFLGKNKKE